MSKQAKAINPTGKQSRLLIGSIVALVIIVGLMFVFIIDSNRKLSEVKEKCAEEIFESLQTISLNLPQYETIDEPGVISAVPGALMRIDTAMRCAEELYDDDLGIPEGSGFSFLSSLFGGKLSRTINGYDVESLLFDGKLSENDHKFMLEFTLALDELISGMTDNGYSLKPGYGYSQLRQQLRSFSDTWTSTGPDSPLNYLSGK